MEFKDFEATFNIILSPGYDQETITLGNNDFNLTFNFDNNKKQLISPTTTKTTTDGSREITYQINNFHYLITKSGAQINNHLKTSITFLRKGDLLSFIINNVVERKIRLEKDFKWNTF